MSKQVIETSRKHIKTIRKSQLESKRNCVWNFPGKGSWSFSNCWLKPMVHCMFIRQKHWKMDDEIKYRWASILLRSGHELQQSLEKCLLHCLLKRKLVLSTNEGVSRVILDTSQVIHLIGVDFKPMYIALFKDGFLFATSNDSQLFYYIFDEVQTFCWRWRTL